MYIITLLLIIHIYIYIYIYIYTFYAAPRTGPTASTTSGSLLFIHYILHMI